MTAGIYLVSACGSAEEFVAAFRRYTDKTGLFVPIASPLPQGKRGRIAITLADGGVMLEGEAEITQSSAKSPLHGRAGIQLKFVDADEPTRTLLAELDKARLAMKPAPTSVAPRPADVPASPRPTPPPIGGRIDAANALAECVAIGDASKLEDAGPPKAGPKFIVPSIPALGGPPRPKTPSTPPEGIAAPPVGKLTTMGMPAMRPPAPDSGPIKSPGDTGAMRSPADSGAMRSPADSGTMRSPSESGPLRTDPRGDPTPLPSPRTDPTPMPASSRTSTLRDAVPPVRTEAPVPTRTAAFDAAWDEEDAAPAPAAKVGAAPTAAPNAPAAKVGSAPAAAPNAPAAKVGSAPTAAPNAPAAKVGSAPTAAPNAPAAKVGSAPTAAPNAPAAKVGSAPTATPNAPAAKVGSAPTAAPSSPAAKVGSAPSAADNGGMPLPKAPSKSKMTQIGFPVVKAPADGPPKATALGMVPLHADEPTATGAPPAPAPPRLPDAAERPAKPPLPQPTPTRSKSPTAPPRNPTPHVPLPVAKLPAKPAPMLADDTTDEKTDLTSVPVAPGAGEILIESKPPVEDPAPEVKPQRSGGMRASEIMAAVTSDDWTMTPDAVAPTVLPAPDKRGPAIEEPTPGPTPTGDWTMSLDPAAGWSKPEQVATPPAEKPTRIERPKAAVQTPATGNELKSVSSEKPIEVQAWEDKPTSIGEKIEIDATLMEPLTPLPAADSDRLPPGNGSGSYGATEQMDAASSGELAASSGDLAASPYPAAGSAPGMAAFEPARVPNATGPAPSIAPPPLPLPPPPTLPPPLPQEIPIGYAPTLLPGQMTAPLVAPPPPPLQYATAQPGDLYRSDSFPLQPERSNKKLLVIIAAAVVVVGVAVVLALTMGHKKKPPVAEKHAGSAAVAVTTGSGSAQAEVVMPTVQDAAVVAPPIDAAEQAVTPPKSETCSVEVTTTPAGAEVALDDKTVLGTTPATLTLPCGQATKLNIKKAKFLGVIRTVTPTPEGVKLAVTLGVATFAVKITSTPAGATIFVAGKSKGVTPAAVQLPAFQTVKIVVSKEGYAADVANVVIKANNMSHHVTLKKSGRRTSESHGLKGI